MPRSKQDRNVAKARQLRRDLSLPEALLWQRLKGSPEGIRIRRQHPIGPYVLDFFCSRRQFAFEIDGQAHDRGDRPEHDQARDQWLSDNGVRVYRIPASDVLADPDEIADSIIKLCSD